MECKNLKQSIREGELLIGVSAPLNASMDQLGRHALHARKIIFNHPINKKSIAISAKIPNEINELRTQITNLNA